MIPFLPKSYFPLTQAAYFLALSRTPHALLDIAAPCLAALLCLARLPSPEVALVGFITAFAGYTAVYALNDLVDYRVDRESFHGGGPSDAARDLDSLLTRHPLAQGLISRSAALVWTISWAMVAMIGAYWLNPFCLLIFLMAAALEALYCLLLRITWLRSVISGIVKTSGPLAAVYAVNPDPAPFFVLLLFFWFFCWEIGGQNIPNDLSDVETDRSQGAMTIPVRFGERASVLLIIAFLAAAYLFSIILAFVTEAGYGTLYLVGIVLSGLLLLLLPASNLYTSPTREKTLTLFNRASYYPLALLFFFIFSLIL